MSQCAPFGAEGPAGVADALSKVDCLATDATSVSFGRLFGAHGSFQTALTIILTLYVALLAFNLLTGRSALRISVLTPRMMTLGPGADLRDLVDRLSVGGVEPRDRRAGRDRQRAGRHATARRPSLFAQQLDGLFTAITDAVERHPIHAGSQPPRLPRAWPRRPTSCGSRRCILLLGTVGVLVVCRLALAALLIIGPVFIVLALFEGTRGLFEGWLKSVAMFALVPLLTVVMGSGALVAIAPMVAGLGAERRARFRSGRAVSILVAAIIYLSLMLLVFKVAGMLTRGWRLGRAQAAPPASAASARRAPGAAAQRRSSRRSASVAARSARTASAARSPASRR